MKQEVRRGRKFVEYHDPETQPEGTFTQEISGADVSYQDEAGNWLPADENWATDGVGGFVLKNDKLNHKIRLKGNGGRTWYPRRNVNTEYMTFGVPQYRNGNKWSNFRFSGWSVEGKTITLNTRQGVTILVHNRWNGIKIDWILANSSAPSRMRYAVSLTGITYVDGIIYGADGTRLGQLTPTTATDSTFDEEGTPTQLPCSGSFAGGYVEFQADVTGAVYPVVIDPDFAGASDSVKIYSTASSVWANRLSSYVGAEMEGSYAYLGILYASPNYSAYRILHKFDTSSIGASSTVTQVNLTLTCVNAYISADYDYYIVKYDWSAYAADLTNATKRQTAYAALMTADLDDSVWCNRLNLAANTPKTSGNLDTTWINKTGITYYGLIVENDRDNVPIEANYLNRHCGASYSVESYRPKLTVTYTAAPTGTLRRTNMNAQMSNLTGGMHG